ncbi:hypothetical protein HMPREF9943_00871 [Eggerthia catenaformis OT 569 = DSM 20559]|uniref:Uncharacterized protein n=1 Tax=Eggerthia catenaformis OT 569 = DSM 20559 TaxID=999415 RepID=M2PMN7_9FIRM|nr:hypothetical protein [Eggerthia catenaformis]EMD16829.1 hypothetical protein HMPREF9943_00871 [Eggerthia catenaformis OT 569 = DSM 20559]OUC51632.1 hypothetical protein B7939_05445 [Eggerthia catenaformis]
MKKLSQLLKKYNKINLEKNSIYDKLLEYHQLFEDNHLKIKIKSDLDLFDYEILLHSLYNEWAIRHFYDEFSGLYSDAFAYLSYEEKRNMFNNDLKPLLEVLPHIQSHGHMIYMPHFESFVNDWYIMDYSITRLKNHRYYLSNQKITLDLPLKNYGDLFNTDFSSLINIKENYYFSKDLNTLYLIKEHKILETYYLKTLKSDAVLKKEDAKELIGYLLSEDDIAFISCLKNKGCIDEKIYKKLLKKG